MHFLLLIDDYLPHSTRVAAKMFHELAIQLKSKGHRVTVVTPSNAKNSNEIHNIDGIKVLSFKSGNVKTKSKAVRAINETLLSFRAWQALSATLQDLDVDGVVYYSPSIFWGALVSRLKRLYKCQSYLVLRDFFPQWAVDAGMIRESSLIEKYFRYFETKSYCAASCIGVMSESNLKIFNRRSNDQYNTEVLYNWADISKNDLAPTNFRSQLGLGSKIIFFYGGNIGSAQDMPTLVRLARELKSDERAHFLFVGQGDQVELINELAKTWRLDNYTYLPSMSQEKFKSLLGEIDIGLFSLAAHHTTHNFPGKLLGYMANRIPILGCVNQGNDLKDVFEKHNAGLISWAGDEQLLLDNAKKLIDDHQLRVRLADSGLKLLKAKFSTESAANQIISGLSRSNQ